MQRRKRCFLTLFLLAVGLCMLPAGAQAERMRGARGEPGMNCQPMPQLSAQEQKTIEELRQKYHGPMMDLRKQISAKRTELNAAMAQEAFDPKKARALGRDINKLQGEMRERHLEMLIEMREKGVSYDGTCMKGDCMKRRMPGKNKMMNPEPPATDKE